MMYWLLKTEPSTWSWQDHNKEVTSMWDGVRNYQARNNLKSMKIGDLCYFYHSITEKSVVGIVEIVKEFYTDPTDKTEKFVAVDVKAVKKLNKKVTLEQIKKNKKLKNILLLKQSRLSVMPLNKIEWDEIIKISKN